MIRSIYHKPADIGMMFPLILFVCWPGILMNAPAYDLFDKVRWTSFNFVIKIEKKKNRKSSCIRYMQMHLIWEATRINQTHQATTHATQTHILAEFSIAQTANQFICLLIVVVFLAVRLPGFDILRNGVKWWLNGLYVCTPRSNPHWLMVFLATGPPECDLCRARRTLVHTLVCVCVCMYVGFGCLILLCDVDSFERQIPCGWANGTLLRPLPYPIRKSKLVVVRLADQQTTTTKK